MGWLIFIGCVLFWMNRHPWGFIVTVCAIIVGLLVALATGKGDDGIFVAAIFAGLWWLWERCADWRIRRDSSLTKH